jgi:serine/threonine-protein kinase
VAAASLSFDGGYAPGEKIAGKYTLLSEIGSGGMGSVWLARNDTTEADVALKIWRAAEEDPDQTKTRFRNEARLSAMLTHRNIVRVFDLITEPNGALVLVMERLQGCTLASYLRANKYLAARAAVGITSGILAALEQAHKAGIVHRDVKPANVFLAVDPDGHVTPKLLDFGIAKVPAANMELTGDGRSLGTPRYMSPEQIRGKEIDGRSDIFSMGVILYEMMTGVSPFTADTPGASLAAVLEVEVDPDPHIDAQLFGEMARGLSKRAYERHASAAEFATALRKSIQCTDAEMDEALRGLEPLKHAEGPSRPITLGLSRIETGDKPKSSKTVMRYLPWAFAAVAILGIGGMVMRGAFSSNASAHPVDTTATVTHVTMPKTPHTSDVPALPTTPSAAPTEANNGGTAGTNAGTNAGSNGGGWANAPDPDPITVQDTTPTTTNGGGGASGGTTPVIRQSGGGSRGGGGGRRGGGGGGGAKGVATTPGF